MFRAKAVTFAIVVAAWMLMAPGAAWGTRALQGSDYSDAVQSDSKVRVCDAEADGYGVHADGTDLYGNGFRVDDQDGAGGNCKNSTDVGEERVWRHRTVEERPKWYEPDVKGDWAYDA